MLHTVALRLSFLACFASLTFSLIVYPRLIESQRTNNDPDRFGQIAFNLSSGNGFVYESNGGVILERAPAYVFIVAIIFKLAGGMSLVGVQIAQAVAHGVASYVLFLIGRMLNGQRVGLIAQIAFSFHPIVLWYTARIWVESTLVLMLLLVAMSFIQLCAQVWSKHATILGGLIGLCCLVKPVLLLFPVVVFIILVWRHGTGGMKAGTIVLIVAATVIAPWTVRNYHYTGKIIPVNTSLGFNLMQGDAVSHTWLDGKGIMETWSIAKEKSDSLLAVTGHSWESAEGDRLLTAYAVDEYSLHPAKLFGRILTNFCSFWYLSESSTKTHFIGVLQILLLTVSILSLITMSREMRRTFVPVFALVAYYVAVNTLIVGWGRYSMPLIPFLLLIVAPLLERFHPHRRS